MIDIDSLEVCEMRAVGIKAHNLAKLNPIMTEQQLQALAIDIAEKGQIVPILIYRGLVVDGRSRIKAAIMNAIDEADIDNGIYSKGGIVKCKTIPHKAPLIEIEELVRSLEIRRMQTPTQLATRAFLNTLDNPNLKKAEAARRAGIGVTGVNNCTRIYNALGKDQFDILVKGGQIELANLKGNIGKYSSIQAIYNLLGEKAKKLAEESKQYRITEFDADKHIRGYFGTNNVGKKEALMYARMALSRAECMIEED